MPSSDFLLRCQGGTLWDRSNYFSGGCPVLLELASMLGGVPYLLEVCGPGGAQFFVNFFKVSNPWYI